MQQLKIQQVNLQDIAAGNEKAFKALFDQYRGRLFYYISRFIKSEQVAEELVLDVFMKIWTGRELITQINNFDAFLFRIAHNKSIDFLRSAAKDQRLQELLWEGIEVAAADETDALLITHEYEEKVRMAISLLSPQCKKVYSLSREQELTHDQIAQQLHISRATVNNHIVLAQRFIRNYLAKEIDLAIVLLLIGRV
ncbi:RNA polymerase sigma-70 factor (ECF subfamily) [Chitinophaga niastensis]|uniref:RNA polymerase sigma-70 factor (ECF subfamily) n=1 Tax=Chitinophaga niastensis TaxID=536980 RepID=A0A2P8HVM7_CHINA|nr:RNA polymerase sigma-70 factor [Chitinophaga niastensis]PSL50282.1 RNA polymerase sigma-70 factor (ECF subfamily) [Chitinophaga niastensis]